MRQESELSLRETQSKSVTEKQPRYSKQKSASNFLSKKQQGYPSYRASAALATIKN